MSKFLGTIEPFNIQDDNWDEYWETLEQYFIVNDIDDKKLTPTFITLIGKEAFSLLRSLVSPKKPSEMKCDDLNKILRNHLQPTPIVIADRYKFYNRNQVENESITDYIAELRREALHCEFEEFLDDALRDRFVCGLRDHNIRKRLLVERTLDLKTALDLAKSMNKFAAVSQSMERERKTSMYSLKEEKYVRRCYRCNSPKHLANSCMHKDKICNHCKQELTLHWTPAFELTD